MLLWQHIMHWENMWTLCSTLYWQNILLLISVKRSILYKDQAVTKREASEIAAHYLSYYWVLLSQPECYSDLLTWKTIKRYWKPRATTRGKSGKISFPFKHDAANFDSVWKERTAWDSYSLQSDRKHTFIYWINILNKFSQESLRREKGSVS